MRAPLLVMALAAQAALAAPAPFELISDHLDADLPAAEVPEAPVRRALEGLEQLSGGAQVLVPLRRGVTAAGARYALAAWRSDARSAAFDAILVLDAGAGARVLEATSSAADVEGALAALLAHATHAPAPPAAAPPPAPTRVERIAAPTEWATRYVLLLAPAVGYRAGTEAAERALTDAHVQYQLRLQHDGVAIAAGPLAADGAAPPADWVGMTLLRVRDRAAAERIAAADPAVAAGRLAATVREWTLPAGRLP